MRLTSTYSFFFLDVVDQLSADLKPNREEEARIREEATACIITIDEIIAEAQLYHVSSFFFAFCVTTKRLQKHQGQRVTIIKPERRKTRRGGKKSSERRQKHQRRGDAKPYFHLDRQDQPVSRKKAKKKASLEKL